MKRLLPALLLLWALPLGAKAQEHPAPGHEPVAAPAHEGAVSMPGHQAGAAGHEGAAGEHESVAEEEEDVSAVLMHHVVDERYGHLYIGSLDVGPTKHLYFFFGAALLVILVIQFVVHFRYKNGVPTGLGSLVEALVLFVRDDIAEKNIGHDGRRFTPLLLSFFFFILIAAFLGLMPFSATSTGNINVTLGLAVVSFIAQQWGGISKFGLIHHFKGLVPPGLPGFLLPIMIPIEILSMFTKPFALMIRLFANMLAGHIVITTLLLLIPLMSAISIYLGIFMIPVSLGLSVFIMFLELLVAFIQAYIFTLLTAIFIGMYAHPAH
jgi:F-type H+-transporting ATPase subunit a